MIALRQIAWGLALVSFAVGGLLCVVGATARGKRCIAVAVALVVAEPLLEAGLLDLRAALVERGYDLTDVALVLGVGAAALAGVVAFARARRGGEPRSTSLKKRVDD